MATNRQQVRMLKALAHPVRLEIVDILSAREECVCHLCAAIGKPQPYISQQLAVLRKAGLVEDVQCGLYVYYRLKDDRVLELRDLVRAMAGESEEDRDLEAEKVKGSEALPGCDCPHCVEARGSTRDRT